MNRHETGFNIHCIASLHESKSRYNVPLGPGLENFTVVAFPCRIQQHKHFCAEAGSTGYVPTESCTLRFVVELEMKLGIALSNASF